MQAFVITHFSNPYLVAKHSLVVMGNVYTFYDIKFCYCIFYLFHEETLFESIITQSCTPLHFTIMHF